MTSIIAFDEASYAYDQIHQYEYSKSNKESVFSYFLWRARVFSVGICTNMSLIDIVGQQEEDIEKMQTWGRHN